ncbi:MAG: nickel-dependent hydrogenase large subunit [Candidatus Promineifilaceae bacterium]|nr:nickel-dependent hydrogenase large subunit [Candidatus Promineifilaceae bacterium]
MCFQNLPIEFDEQGRAYLREEVENPYAYQRHEIDRSRIEELLARNGHIKDVNIDPVTRVAGALAFHSVVDLKERRVYEANSVATLFRGYEVILKGRDPRDAMFISSRVCGVCGGVHSVASSLAIEMAFGIAPPPLGLALRNIQLALDFCLDNPLHLYILAGPDFSEVVVKNTNPSLWERAKKAETRHADVHGYETIAEIMTALNPLTGQLYLEGLNATRVPREAYAILYGKYPHPQTVVPGGLSTTVSLKELNETHNRIVRTLDFGKKGVFIWNELTDFFYDADPRYKEVGKRPKNLMDTGIWDDPFAYDGTYANAPEWGLRRWATPGIVIDGELVTTNLHHINVGLEEFVEHSYYEDWSNETLRHRFDPAGNPISPHHPWNKETKPAPVHKRSWKDRYTWDTCPRWDRHVMEAGTYARMWTTAAAQQLPHTRFLESTGHSLKMHVPKTVLPAMDLEWRIPEVWNAFERNRNRAYHIVYCQLVAYENLLLAMDLLKRGYTKVATPYEVPQDHRIGVGFWGAGRGWLTHHLEMDKGALINYQIITPSTINAAPVDPFGNPGAYEEAVLNTPILEEFDKPEEFTGIDIFRAIRSFDPCMPCTTHIYADDHVVSREVNTCGCGIE